MWHKGFTLVELMVVISILSLLGLVSYANIRKFREGQVIEKSASDLQSLLRLAQSNATARLKCNGQFGATWLVEFANRQTINLKCYVNGPASTQQTLSFSGTNIQVNIIQGRQGISTCDSSFTPSVTNTIEIRFAPLYGTVMFYDSVEINNCLTRSTTTEAVITLRDTQRNTTKAVVAKKGGAIIVE